MITPPRVALVYDWVTMPYGGAEKVLLALHEAFPTAPLFTAVADLERAGWAKGFTLHTSFLQSLPGIKRNYRWWSWLMPLAFECFDFSEFDVVISITSAEAKGVITSPNQLHICYLLTPPRYLYSHSTEYLRGLVPPARPLARLFLKYVKWWDQVAVYRPDVIIPISKTVARRVADFHSLSTTPPVYPPATLRTQVTANLPLHLPGKYLLIVSRLVKYKRIDLAIQACKKLSKTLVIVGDGPEKRSLEALAKNAPQVHFVGHQPEEVVTSLLTQSSGLLMPGIEDFGITALDAQLLGKPVIVHSQSGVAKLLEEKKFAIFLSELSVPAMCTAIEQLEELVFDSKVLRQRTRKYATTTFIQKFRDTVLQLWQHRRQERMV